MCQELSHLGNLSWKLPLFMLVPETQGLKSAGASHLSTLLMLARQSSLPKPEKKRRGKWGTNPVRFVEVICYGHCMSCHAPQLALCDTDLQPFTQSVLNGPASPGSLLGKQSLRLHSRLPEAKFETPDELHSHTRPKNLWLNIAKSEFNMLSEPRDIFPSLESL